jgi:putative DNA primase/helicase
MGENGKVLKLQASRAPDGRARIVALVDDREVARDVCDLWSDEDCDRVAGVIHRAVPALELSVIRRQLMLIDREKMPDGDGGVGVADLPWDDPEPLPDPLVSVMPYQSDLLPPEIGDAVSDIAERMQCPPDFPAASMLVALAAVVGCQIGIRPRRYDDWLVVPNLWGCVVGRPSLKKSPAIGHAEKRIRAIEARERERMASELEQFRVDELLAEAAVKSIRQDIARAYKSGDEGEARRLALELKTLEEAAPPVPRRIITTDSTIEKIGEMLNKYPNGMMLWVDELVGWMRGLDRQDMAGVRQQFLTLWNGVGRLNIDRVGRGETVVEYPCLSLFGCATPGGIGDYVAAALRGGRGDDGLIQRLQILVWPDSPKEYRQVDRWPDSPARDRLVAVFEALADLDVDSFAERDQFDDGGIPWLRFDADGQAIFDRWDAEIQNRIRSADLHEAFESHLTKYASLVPSVALVIHLAMGGRGPVSGDAAAMAVRWAEYLESHAARLYSIAVAPERRLTKPLLMRLIDWPKDKPIRVRDIVRNCWSGLDCEESVAPVMELLADAGWVRAVPIRPPSGRPTVNFVLHPRAAEFSQTLLKRTDKTDKTRPVSSSGSFGSTKLESIEKKSAAADRVQGVI